MKQYYYFLLVPITTMILMGSCTSNSDGPSRAEPEVTVIDSTIHSDSNGKPQDGAKTEAAIENVIPEPEDGAVRMQFKRASFGDMLHLTFESKEGQVYSFSNNSDQNIVFMGECEEGESDEDSNGQGFCTNKEHVGKWFDVSFITEKTQGNYADYMDSIMVIIKAKPIENTITVSE